MLWSSRMWRSKPPPFVSNVKRSTEQMKHVFSMFDFFAARSPRSSPKVSMMIPKITLSSTVTTIIQKVNSYRM